METCTFCRNEAPLVSIRFFGETIAVCASCRARRDADKAEHFAAMDHVWEWIDAQKEEDAPCEP